jgi:hypothetical protein
MIGAHEEIELKVIEIVEHGEVTGPFRDDCCGVRWVDHDDSGVAGDPPGVIPHPDEFLDRDGQVIMSIELP